MVVTPFGIRLFVHARRADAADSQFQRLRPRVHGHVIPVFLEDVHIDRARQLEPVMHVAQFPAKRSFCSPVLTLGLHSGEVLSVDVLVGHGHVDL